jgi:hypothetical protein
MCPSKYYLKKHKNHGSKGLSRIITWLGYKRNVICGIIEFKRPNIEEHSFYLQPISLNFIPNPWWQSINTLILTTYSIFDFSFFFFSFSNVHICVLFLHNFLLSDYYKIHHDTWHNILTSLSPQPKHNITLIECSPILRQGTKYKKVKGSTM